MGSIKFQKSVFAGPDFIQVAEGMLGMCDRTEFQQFVGIARRIWLWQNEVVHGGFFHIQILLLSKHYRLLGEEIHNEIEKRNKLQK